MSLILPVEGTPGVHDLLRRAQQRRSRLRARSGRPAACSAARAADRPADARRFQRRRDEVMAERSGVSAERQLSIGEIIARHQQQQRAQDALVKNYIAHARMQQHFRPTVTDPGYDVVTENRYFVAGAGRRVGRAVVLGQRLEVGRRSPAVSAAAAGKSAVAAAAAALRRRLSLSAGRHRARRRATTATSSDSIRCAADSALYHGHRVDRQEDVRARPRAGGPGRALGAGRLERGNAALHAGRRSATARCSCSAD